MRLVAHGGDVGAERRAAEVRERRARGLPGQGPNARQKRGEDCLAVRLPDRAETKSGGDEIGRLREGERLETGSKREPVAAGRGGDRDGIGDGAVRRPIEPPQRLAIPGCARRGDERPPLRGILSPAATSMT